MIHPVGPPDPPPPAPPFWSRMFDGFTQTPRTAALAWHSSRRGVLALAGLSVSAAATTVAIAWVGKFIIDAVVVAQRTDAGDAAIADVVFWIAVEFGLVIASTLTDRGLLLARQLLGSRLSIDINTQILEQALKFELRQFEDSRFYDQLTRARREASSRPLALIQEHMLMLRNLLTLGGYVALLFRFSPWIVVGLVIAAIPSLIAELRFTNVTFQLRNWRSPVTRRMGYIEHVLTDDKHAKEVRVFGLGRALLGRHRTIAETSYAEDRALALRRAGWTSVVAVFSSTAFYGCYLAIALAAARGLLSLGEMTLYIVAFRQGRTAFQNILTAVSGMYEHNLYMSNLFEFLAIPTPSPSPPRAPVKTAERGVRFENVGFRYDPTGPWALRHLSLFVPQGQSLALVGENGAGKTTFVKLLTRLYTPTEGQVLLDGRDLRDWDEAALRGRIGVIFQDFNRYQFVLRENVGFGSVEHLSDLHRLTRAIERGGAKEVVATLSAGLETQLGRWFQDGVELSGGEWQKIALARAFMREEADILVLDEPTAALDAEAEHAIFRRFRTLTSGRTSILISHRFPTVRIANRILVFEHGRVIEDGTHDQLLAASGRYARLFTLQAEGYR